MLIKICQKYLKVNEKLSRILSNTEHNYFIRKKKKKLVVQCTLYSTVH